MTYREPIVQNPRREIAIGIGIRRREVELAGAELLSIEPFGIGGSDTLRGYRQEALLADSRIFDSAELRYPMQAHPRQPRSFAGDGVCGFWQSLASQGKRGFGSEYFAVSPIAAAVTVRRKVKCSRRRGNSFD
ncbi:MULTISPECIES: hypothetical protein [unclassified Microcoleus]|uniref:hypothetical protein n=1 Tax=unclassified Microcoleus TaxID=2642155 RepID=UPI002FD70335